MLAVKTRTRCRRRRRSSGISLAYFGSVEVCVSSQASENWSDPFSLQPAPWKTDSRLFLFILLFMPTCGQAECVFTVCVCVCVFVCLVHVCISQSACSACVCVCVCVYICTPMSRACVCSRASCVVSVFLFELLYIFTCLCACVCMCVFVFSQCKPVEGKLVVEGKVNEWWCYLFGLADCTFSGEKKNKKSPTVSLIPSRPPPPETESTCVCVCVCVKSRSSAATCVISERMKLYLSLGWHLWFLLQQSSDGISAIRPQNNPEWWIVASTRHCNQNHNNQPLCSLLPSIQQHLWPLLSESLQFLLSCLFHVSVVVFNVCSWISGATWVAVEISMCMFVGVSNTFKQVVQLWSTKRR